MLHSDTRFAEVHGARLYYEVAGTAHMLNMERPEAFNHVVQDFLNG